MDAAPVNVRLAHVQEVLEASSEGMVRLDRDGRAVTWNRAAARVLAPAARLARGMLLAEVFADRLAVQELLERVLAGERVTARSLDVDADDGRRGQVQLTLVPLHDGERRTVGSTALLRDLSEETSAQEALAEGERRVRRAEALAMIGTFVIDTSGQSTQWSEGMYQVLGVDPADWVPTMSNHLALVADEDRAGVEDMFARTLAGENVNGMDHRIDRPDGTQSWVFVAVEPRTDAEGRVLGISGVCQDVNTRIDTEAALQDALHREQEVSEELRRLDVLKDEFLSTASHELRTPLTSIAGFASLLAKTTPDKAEFIEPIERNARDMQRLVEALLDQARLESGRVTIHPTRFALATAVAKLLSDTAQQLGKSYVVTEIADDMTIDMDRQAFSLVLGNLVTNAAKYAADGTITISAEQGSDYVTVSVADEGPGIPEEHQAHLFEPFFRVPGDLWSIRGSGFGLSIVRRYVDLHGGEVACDSRPGSGTTFSFRVPTIQGT